MWTWSPPERTWWRRGRVCRAGTPHRSVVGWGGPIRGSKRRRLGGGGDARALMCARAPPAPLAPAPPVLPLGARSLPEISQAPCRAAAPLFGWSRRGGGGARRAAAASLGHITRLAVGAPSWGVTYRHDSPLGSTYRHHKKMGGHAGGRGRVATTRLTQRGWKVLSIDPGDAAGIADLFDRSRRPGETRTPPRVSRATIPAGAARRSRFSSGGGGPLAPREVQTLCPRPSQSAAKSRV